MIDGHHHHAICTKHNIPFLTQSVDIESLDDAKLWIFKHQEHRRNLTTFHRAEIALKLKDTIAAKAKERQIRKPADSVPQTFAEQKETRHELAEMADVSHTTLDKAEYIANNADEERKEKLRNGEKGTSINKEYKKLKDKEKQQSQSEATETAKEASDEFYPAPPCPNAHIKYFPSTTLKLIPQESPHVLLANLFAHFRKGFVEEMVVMAMEQIHENIGKVAVNKIMRELNSRYPTRITLTPPRVSISPATPSLSHDGLPDFK